MATRFEVALSLRYLLSRKRERSLSLITGFAVAGVVLGVATLVVAMAVMNGYQTNMIRAMAGALPHLSVYPGQSEGFRDPETLADRLQARLDAESVSLFQLREALVSNPRAEGGNMRGVILRGVDASRERRVEDFLAFLDDGSPEWERLPVAERLRRARALLRRLEAPVAPGVFPVLLSPLLAERLGVGLGQRLVPLKFPEAGEGFSPLPVSTRLEVIGYFETGILAFDELVLLLDVHRIEAIYPGSRARQAIGVRLEDPMAAGAASSQVRRMAPRDEGRLQAYSWLENNRSLFQVIRVQKVMLFIVLMLIVVIAFFGIIGAMVMMVAEKSREVAILKSLGARERSIRRIFFLQGMYIGGIGTVIGVAAGLGVCWLLGTFPVIEIPPGVYPGSDRIPVRVAWADVLMVVAGTLAVSLAATVYPARKAMRLSPVRGLRYS